MLMNIFGRRKTNFISKEEFMNLWAYMGRFRDVYARADLQKKGSLGFDELVFCMAFQGNR